MPKGLRVLVSTATLTAIGCALVTFCTVAHGQGNIRGLPGIQAFDPREIRLLPPFCINTDTFRDRIPGGRNSTLIEQWHAQMGPTFIYMHHYCYGLMKTNRATLFALDQATRTFYLRDAVAEFDFVIARAAPDFYLLPEILTRKGENLIRLGLGEAGLLDLERAIELKRDYWPAYAHISDFHKSKGDLRAARQWLQQGLAESPDSKGLLRRLAELDVAEQTRRGGANKR